MPPSLAAAWQDAAQASHREQHALQTVRQDLRLQATAKQANHAILGQHFLCMQERMLLTGSSRVQSTALLMPMQSAGFKMLPWLGLQKGAPAAPEGM